jgi:hypothetical protein
MGRGPARDRLPDYLARVARSVARSVRDGKGLTNQDVADRLGWSDARRVRDILARERHLRAANIEVLLKALRDEKPRVGSLYERHAHAAARGKKLIETVMVGVETSRRVPSALIPKWAIRSVADYLAHTISQLEPGINRKRYAELLRRALHRAAGPMAQQCYQYFKDEWLEGCPADLMLRPYGLPSSDDFLVYDKE